MQDLNFHPELQNTVYYIYKHNFVFKICITSISSLVSLGLSSTQFISSISVEFTNLAVCLIPGNLKKQLGYNHKINHFLTILKLD